MSNENLKKIINEKKSDVKPEDQLNEDQLNEISGGTSGTIDPTEPSSCDGGSSYTVVCSGHKYNG